MIKYALVNEKGIVYGISNLKNKVDNANMILISDDFDTTNKKYVNGEWVKYEPKPLPIPTPEPTQLDIIQGMVAKSNEELRQEGYDNCVMDMIKEGVI